MRFLVDPWVKYFLKSNLYLRERNVQLILNLYCIWAKSYYEILKYFFFSETFPLTLRQIFLKDDSFETRATNIAPIVLLAFAKVDSTDRTSGLSDFFYFFFNAFIIFFTFLLLRRCQRFMLQRLQCSMDAFPSPTLTIRAWVRLQKYAGPRSQSHWPSTKRGSSTSSPWERTVTCGNVWLLMSMYRSRMCRASTNSLEACSRSSRGTCNWISQSCY